MPARGLLLLAALASSAGGQERPPPPAGGPVVSAACHVGRPDLREFLRDAGTYAVEQVRRCERVLGFRESSDWEDILRRSTVACAANVGGLAGAERFYDHGWRPFQRPLGSFRTRPGFDKTYVIGVWDGFAPWLVEQLEPADALALMSATLAHEALHHAGANNTAWHNRAGQPGLDRGLQGCERSLFEDRTYFLSAACFPASAFGKAFYDEKTGMPSCPALCMRALTRNDEDVVTGEEDVAGPPYVRPPYAPGDARLLCRRIRDLAARRAVLEGERNEVFERNAQLSRFVKANLEAEDAAAVEEDVDRLAGAGIEAHRGGADLAGARRRFEAAAGRLAAAMDRLCPQAGGGPPAFCGSGPLRVRSEIRRLRAQLEAAREEDLLLFVPPP